MTITAHPRPAPILGNALMAPLPASSHQGHLIVVRDGTSAGTWAGPVVDYGIGAKAPKQLADTVWSTLYAALYYFNRSPWVERGIVGPITSVKLLGHNDPIPAGAWVLELLDTSDQEGAIGYHEGQARVSKSGPSGAHSERGIALHPASGTEIVLMKAFVKTARQDNVYTTEVIVHEMNEAAVDPYVNNEDEIRTYKNPADGKEYIGEVGDPVQERAFDVGAPEGRPCGVPEAFISDCAYPSWWGQPQTRPFTSLAEELELAPRLEPFQIAPGGYMSTRIPGGEWEQEFGSKHAAAKVPNPE